MSVLAVIRPDETSLALFVHVLGAMVLVGGAFTALGALLLSWRGAGRDVASYARLAFRALLFAALPGWIVMRIGAEWTRSEENIPSDAGLTWLDIGYITADLGALVLLVALIVGGVGVRKLRSGGGTGLVKASTMLALVMLALYVVAVWAMAGKPD
jgi:hypothetical protein